MHLPIAKFGNLALDDATRLADTLDREAADWAVPAAAPGRWPRAGAGGRLLGVGQAAPATSTRSTRSRHGVSRVAQGLHLFVDRRVFRPEVQLGTINDRTTAAYLEQLLAALDAFESAAWWQTTVSLLSPPTTVPDQPPFKAFRDIPLGPPSPTDAPADGSGQAIGASRSPGVRTGGLVRRRRPVGRCRGWRARPSSSCSSGIGRCSR